MGRVVVILSFLAVGITASLSAVAGGSAAPAKLAESTFAPGTVMDTAYPRRQASCRGSGWIPDPGHWAAQTFVPTRSGLLTDVVLALSIWGGVAPGESVPVDVSITRVGENDAPALSEVLASITAQVRKPIDGSRDVNAEFQFPTPANVIAETRYAIVMKQREGVEIAWAGDLGVLLPLLGCAAGTYGGGRGWADQGAEVGDTTDFYFWTYVKSSVAPTPARAEPVKSDETAWP